MVSEPPRKSISKEGNQLNDALPYRLITSSSRYAFLPLIYPVYPAKRLKRSGAKSSGLISPNLYAGRKITIPCNWVVSTGRINNTAESLSRFSCFVRSGLFVSTVEYTRKTVNAGSVSARVRVSASVRAWHKSKLGP